jgi:hypothetical protein
MQNNSPQTALVQLDRADERLAFARREIVTEPLGMFQSKTSSPLTAHVSLIPLHWQLANQLANRQWQPNGLPAGDFENLKHMIDSGWENRRLEDVAIDTRVELEEGSAAFGGQYGLKLTVDQPNNPADLDATPLWITTPPVPVRGGQLVRIHGWVHVPEVLQGNPDGLKIVDSIGGTGMCERIPITQGWQEFTLYRGVDATGNLRVTFELTGAGQAMLDEVTIRAVSLPRSSRQAQLNGE